MARVDDIYLHGLCGARMLMHLCDDHVDDISLHTYIHRYVVFLVVLISVGLALARPNHDPYLLLAYSHFL